MAQHVARDLDRRGVDESWLRAGVGRRQGPQRHRGGPGGPRPEDNFGQGAALAAARLAGRSGGGVGRLAARRTGAVDWVALGAAEQPGSMLVAGASPIPRWPASRWRPRAVPPPSSGRASPRPRVYRRPAAWPMTVRGTWPSKWSGPGGAGPSGLRSALGDGYRVDLLRAMAWAVAKLVGTPPPKELPPFKVY